jgi:hypothetical protein
MFTPKQYRAKATEYTELAKAANSPNKVREFQKLERSFTVLADNEQWLTDNYNQTVRATAHVGATEVTLAAEEEHILRCLGAALIMQWNTLPRKLQRELFDNASSMGDLSSIVSLRGQVARFLHKHKDSEGEIIGSAFAKRDDHVPTQ